VGFIESVGFGVTQFQALFADAENCLTDIIQCNDWSSG